jgi:FkbM family methyltransferase
MRRRLNGGPFWCDFEGIKLPFHGDGDIQEVYYYLGGKSWWEREHREFSRLLSPGDVAVDVGANFGLYSGVFSSLTGLGGQVHSFEPSPSVYAKFLQVISKNNYTNVSPYNLGCGKDEGSMTLYSASCSGNATLRPNAHMVESAQALQDVRIVNLDAFLGPKLDRLDLLKIDTEGYEDEVLSGAIGLLQKYKPIVYLELSSQYLAQSQNAVGILRKLGYTFNPELNLEQAYLGDNFFAYPPGSQLSPAVM